MCGGKPCFNSVCGLSLQKSVIIIGFVQLGITVIATILNVIKLSKGYQDDCDGKDICIGPIIKYAVFDALFGVSCSLLLVFGAKLRNHCLLVFWIIITVISSAKYIWIVSTRDWSDLEDWISIAYLLFYLTVFLIICSLMKEVKHNSSAGYVHGPAPNTTVVIHQQIPLQQAQPLYPPPTQPQPQYPPPNQPQPLYPPPNQPPPYTQQPPYNAGYYGN